MSGKIAFLFLTKGNHNCETAWALFFRGVPETDYSLYCHPKTRPTQAFLKNNILPKLTPTRWGDISLIRATLLLLGHAYQNAENSYFILVSDSCIPVVAFTTLQQTLFKTRRSFLSWRHIDNRLDRYQRLSNSLKNRLKWDHFYSQHQWMILRRDHVRLALQNNLLDDFSGVHACDEHYFVTLFYLAGVLFKETHFLRKKITYCDWSDRKAMHPREFNSLDDHILERAHQEQAFFIRKINPKCHLSKYLYFILTFKDKTNDITTK